MSKPDLIGELFGGDRVRKIDRRIRDAETQLVDDWCLPSVERSVVELRLTALYSSAEFARPGKFGSSLPNRFGVRRWPW